jgi:hypothetical protein
MYEKKLIPNNGNIVKSCSFKLKPLKTIYVYNGNDISRGKKDKKNIKYKPNDTDIEIWEEKPDTSINCFKEKLYDTIWLGIHSILIRLEAINEDNFECLISTIERQHKEWEITKIIDESFLKIYL